MRPSRDSARFKHNPPTVITGGARTRIAITRDGTRVSITGGPGPVVGVGGIPDLF